MSWALLGLAVVAAMGAVIFSRGSRRLATIVCVVLAVVALAVAAGLPADNGGEPQLSKRGNN